MGRPWGSAEVWRRPAAVRVAAFEPGVRYRFARIRSASMFCGRRWNGNSNALLRCGRQLLCPVCGIASHVSGLRACSAVVGGMEIRMPCCAAGGSFCARCTLPFRTYPVCEHVLRS